MELSFAYKPDRNFYAVRFDAGAQDTVPFIRELRFWGVDRVPCPRLSTLAALIALKSHPMSIVTVRDTAINPPICSALSKFFGLEIYPARYEAERRDLAGGEKIVLPVRFAQMAGRTMPDHVIEVLPWLSTDNLDGPLGAAVRTNIDAFSLSEVEKNLVVALCCAGKDLGHVWIDGIGPDLSDLLHIIGLEAVDPTAFA